MRYVLVVSITMIIYSGTIRWAAIRAGEYSLTVCIGATYIIKERF
jgi:hypothetical protein